ncbi:MAG TPA: class I SAM-dependent methyltransferase [Acidimicrobiales bacterium]|nr:class I SAM-dependent methyltransferase [Acidimicrobiales bacterium]
MEPPAAYRFYGDLARWWPLISPPEEYAEEMGFVARLLGSAAGPVREVLELGCGGGHSAFHLKARLDLTLVDISPEMLEASRRLNPGCQHLQGDMRTVRLGRTFDAVLVHDAIDYMTTEPDLRLAVGTASAHCRPGGVVVLVPDATVETFEPGSDHGGGDEPDGRGARYLNWLWDPDPDDSWTLTQYAFLLREADGSVQVVHEEHRCGLFPQDLWLAVLADAGLRPEAVTEETTEERTPRQIFLGHVPG